MLKSERVSHSPTILNALLSNPNLSGIQSESIRNLLQPPEAAPSAPVAEPEPSRRQRRRWFRRKWFRKKRKLGWMKFFSWRRPIRRRKLTGCWMKACSPIFPRMRMRLRPRAIIPTSRSAASTMNWCPALRNRWQNLRLQPQRRTRPRPRGGAAAKKAPVEEDAADRRGRAGQRAAENRQAGHQRAHPAGHERLEGRAVASDP